MLRLAQVGLPLMLLVAPAALAQQPTPPQELHPLVVEQEVRERWIQGGEHPGFVPFVQRRSDLHVRPRPRRKNVPWWSLELRERSWEATLSLDQSNRMTSVRVSPNSVSLDSYSIMPGAFDPRLMFHGSLRDRIATLWEIPVTLPAGELVTGMRWTDTLSFYVEPAAGTLESLEGVWEHEVVGDTLLEGRRLLWVRTTADVRFRRLESLPDAGMEGHQRVERRVSGALVGAAALDAELGLRVAGSDTAHWAGTATLHLQDGRSFDAPLSYERVRQWALTDSTTWAAVQDSLREERARRDGGMLILPRTDLQERLAEGDPVAADSLRERWRRTDDPDERARVGSLLRSWAAVGEIEAWMEESRRELGDTATVLAERLRGGSRLTSLSEDDLDERLPYLDDIGRMWQLGVVPRWTYSSLAESLLHDTPILRPDTAAWTCTPAACERVMALVDAAHEPRLRDVALVAAFARDPARWFDRLQARADAGSLIVRNAIRMGEGVGATWPAARGDSVPPPGASWRLWLAWMGDDIRFQRPHVRALRMYSARTGRDVVAELRDTWPPESDSARAVLGTILNGMGALEAPTLEALGEEFLSGSWARVRVARRELSARVPLAERGERADGRLAPPEVRAEVLLPLLDSLLADGGRSPWPGVGPDGASEPSIQLFMEDFHGEGDVPLFLLDQNLPSGFIPDPATGFEIIAPETWDARPRRAGGVRLSLGPLIQAGPFVAVSWNWVALRQREADEAPGGYAGGGAFRLLRTGEGWIVVDAEGWIT